MTENPEVYGTRRCNIWQAMEASQFRTENTHVSFVCFIFVLIALSIIYQRHSRFSIPLYPAQIRPVLILHISVGLIKLLGLYLQPMFFGRERIPNLLDLVLCFAQSGTNMALVKRMPRGQWMMTCPSYQVGAIMRPVLTLSAILHKRPDLHTSSLRIIHAFIYTRCPIYIWSKARLLDKYSDIYMVAVFSAAVLAMADTPFPAILSKAYVVCVAGISLLNHWTVKQITEFSTLQSIPKAHLLTLLLRLGLVGLPILKGRKLPDMIDDDYCDNNVANGTETRNPTEAQEVVDRVSQTLEDKIETQTQAMTGMPATEGPSANELYLMLWTDTKDLIPEIDDPSTHSQIVTITYSSRTMEHQNFDDYSLRSRRYYGRYGGSVTPFGRFCANKSQTSAQAMAVGPLSSWTICFGGSSRRRRYLQNNQARISSPGR